MRLYLLTCPECGPDGYKSKPGDREACYYCGTEMKIRPADPEEEAVALRAIGAELLITY